MADGAPGQVGIHAQLAVATASKEESATVTDHHRATEDLVVMATIQRYRHVILHVATVSIFRLLSSIVIIL